MIEGPKQGCKRATFGLQASSRIGLPYTTDTFNKLISLRVVKSAHKDQVKTELTSLCTTQYVSEPP